MPKATDIDKANKTLADAVKKLQDTQHASEVRNAELKRENLKLKTANIHEQKKIVVLEGTIKELNDSAADIEKHNAELTSVTYRLKEEVGNLSVAKQKVSNETEAIQADNDLLEATIAERRESIDIELEAYAETKKREIKSAILAENAKLKEIQDIVETIRTEVETKREELAQLNAASIQEQEDLKTSHASIQTEIASEQQKLDDLSERLEAAGKKYEEEAYKTEQAEIRRQKAEEDHQKFLEYEKKARVILDTKDKQLQATEADISQDRVMLQNRRSNLAKL